MLPKNISIVTSRNILTAIPNNLSLTFVSQLTSKVTAKIYGKYFKNSSETLLPLNFEQSFSNIHLQTNLKSCFQNSQEIFLQLHLIANPSPISKVLLTLKATSTQRRIFREVRLSEAPLPQILTTNHSLAGPLAIHTFEILPCSNNILSNDGTSWTKRLQPLYTSFTPSTLHPVNASPRSLFLISSSSLSTLYTHTHTHTHIYAWELHLYHT